MERESRPFWYNGNDYVRLVDVSHHNNVGEVENDIDLYDVSGLIIRATYGTDGRDKKFKDFVELARKLHIPYGIYYYSYAIEPMEVNEEIRNFFTTIAEENVWEDELFRLGVYFDYEDADGYKNDLVLDGERGIQIVNESLKQLWGACNFAGLYCSEWLMNSLFESAFNEANDNSGIFNGKIYTWIAKWGLHASLLDKTLKEIPAYNYTIWQYSDTPLDVNLMPLDIFKKLKREGGRFA